MRYIRDKLFPLDLLGRAPARARHRFKPKRRVWSAPSILPPNRLTRRS
jgi:hypothetical protein